MAVMWKQSKQISYDYHNAKQIKAPIRNCRYAEDTLLQGFMDGSV